MLLLGPRVLPLRREKISCRRVRSESTCSRPRTWTLKSSVDIHLHGVVSYQPRRPCSHQKPSRSHRMAVALVCLLSRYCVLNCCRCSFAECVCRVHRTCRLPTFCSAKQDSRWCSQRGKGIPTQWEYLLTTTRLTQALLFHQVLGVAQQHHPSHLVHELQWLSIRLIQTFHGPKIQPRNGKHPSQCSVHCPTSLGVTQVRCNSDDHANRSLALLKIKCHQCGHSIGFKTKYLKCSGCGLCCHNDCEQDVQPECGLETPAKLVINRSLREV